MTATRTLEERARELESAIAIALEAAFKPRSDRRDRLPYTAKEAERRGGNISALILAALRSAVEAERERCARVAEDHLDHIDIPTRQDQTQQHGEPPYICCVAAAIRAGGSDVNHNAAMESQDDE